MVSLDAVVHDKPEYYKYTIPHHSAFKAAWDWLILLLVMYTAIFTPYVAAFLLDEMEFNSSRNKFFSTDPISIIDLIGKVKYLKFLNCK